MLKEKNILNAIGIIGSLILFVIIAFVYASPVLHGDQLYQHDIVEYKGSAKELLDYRATHHEETYWSDAMFGGMPTYQTGAQFRGDIIKRIDDILMIFPKPINYLFLLFSGFFFLGMVAVRNWQYALLGATFFGLSTYFYIIIGAGHNGKIHTIAYFAPLLAGILLIYLRKNYILGFITTTLFMGLQIAANHLQMTYYLFIGLFFLFLSELVRSIIKKTEIKHFLISTSIIGGACMLGIAMNSQRISANSEYIKETVRGKQILNNDKQSPEKSGMDKESALAWSYGKTETLNLLIPRLMGGASSEKGSEKAIGDIQNLIAENSSSEEEFNKNISQISKGLSSISYWGDQPMTSGPAYQGAVVVFLAILGFFFAPKRYQYWVLGASILCIGLAWGSNFPFLSDLFIDFVPFYNKFRAPSSILVVVELLFPLIGIVGLFHLLKNNIDETEIQQKTKKLITISGVIFGLIIFLLAFSRPLLGFCTDNERAYLPPYILDYLVNYRQKMFQEDTIKTILYISIIATTLFFTLKRKINSNVALIIIGFVSLFDLWSVNKRYLNNDNFIDKIFAENPFQTENTDLLTEKISENDNLKSLLTEANINKTLEDISQKDTEHYRIFNQILGTFGETNTSYFKSSIGGYHAVKLRRYDDLINEYFYSQDSLRQKEIPNILNILNTKYLILGNAENPNVQINPESNGNAWFVSNIKWAKSPNEEIDLIGKIDNKKTAVINEKDFKNILKSQQFVADSTANIQLTKYQPNELKYISQSSTNQLAVFSEIYYPYGWKAFVDGKEVEILRANYLLRAIPLSAGKHEIKMIFQPQTIKTGKWISALAFGLFILISLGFGFWKYKNRKILA